VFLSFLKYRVPSVCECRRDDYTHYSPHSSSSLPPLLPLKFQISSTASCAPSHPDTAKHKAIRRARFTGATKTMACVSAVSIPFLFIQFINSRGWYGRPRRNCRGSDAQHPSGLFMPPRFHSLSTIIRVLTHLRVPILSSAQNERRTSLMEPRASPYPSTTSTTPWCSADLQLTLSPSCALARTFRASVTAGTASRVHTRQPTNTHFTCATTASLPRLLLSFTNDGFDITVGRQ
jgi:hypothetical protein